MKTRFETWFLVAILAVTIMTAYWIDNPLQKFLPIPTTTVTELRIAHNQLEVWESEYLAALEELCPLKPESRHCAFVGQ